MDSALGELKEVLGVEGHAKAAQASSAKADAAAERCSSALAAGGNAGGAALLQAMTDATAEAAVAKEEAFKAVSASTRFFKTSLERRCRQ